MSDIYSEFILELYKNPLNFGKIENPDLHGIAYNSLCGDRIELFIKLENGKISDIKHTGTGCAISQVSASLLTEHLKGKSIEEAKNIKKENVLDLIRIDLSKNPSRMKCALLSLEALKKAIK
jgi:nitrogen fixation NifU-like protein